MLSMRSLYALEALTALARHDKRGVFPLAEIAEEEKIPRKFLESILLALKKDGILASKKGPKGGYALATPPHELSVGRIIRTLEGVFTQVQCLNRGSPPACGKCCDSGACGIRLLMGELRDNTSALLDSVSSPTCCKGVLRPACSVNGHSITSSKQSQPD